MFCAYLKRLHSYSLTYCDEGPSTENATKEIHAVMGEETWVKENMPGIMQRIYDAEQEESLEGTKTNLAETRLPAMVSPPPTGGN